MRREAEGAAEAPAHQKGVGAFLRAGQSKWKIFADRISPDILSPLVVYG